MNRFLGLGAVVLVGITAWVGLSRQAVQVSAPMAERQQTTSPAKVNATAAKNPWNDEVGCEAVEEAFKKFFLIDSEDVKAPSNCFVNKVQNPAIDPKLWLRASNAHYVIALMPDPIHTHMAATFDEWVESIEHAAESERFTYDSSWFPWREAESPSTLLAENLKASEIRRIREEQPGVMFFRNADPGRGDGNPYSNALVVFVVGEQATAGVNKKQFENAVGWLQVLDPRFASERLSILGPSASGSFASLEDLLNHGILQTKMELQIVSGAVSSGTEIDRFNAQLRQRLVGNSVMTFNENTKLEIQRYLRLLALEGYDNQRVAVVSEDETAFGKDSNDLPRTGRCVDDSRACGPGLSLSYPRDIASLRSAYQREGLIEAESNTNEYTSQQRLLKEDLGENAEDASDTVKTYSDGQKDLSDEAELLQVVLRLRQDQIQYVLLISSNPYDQIFLTQFLRAACPSVRIVILASNQLLFRVRGSGGFRGVLTLSPYPLSPDVQTWTTDNRLNERQIFTTDTAQGVYYATRYLLRAIAAGGDSEGFLPGYAAPPWMDKSPDARIPPTWLAVISAGRPWPVAALDEWSLDRYKGFSGARGNSGVLLPMPQVLMPNASPQLLASIQLPIEFQLAVIGCVLWMLLHIYFRRKASVIHKPRLRAYFSLTTWWQHSLVLSLSWACIGQVAISLAWCLRYVSHVSIPCVIYWVLALILVILVCAGYPVYDWLSNRDEYPPTLKGAVAGFLSTTVMLSYIEVLWKLTPRWNEATSASELLRGVHLLSGVSPAAPFVILAIGGYLWCLQNLHGLALFNDDQPMLPSREQLRLDAVNSRCPNGESLSSLEDRESMLRMFAADDYEIGRGWGLPLSKNVVWLLLIAFGVLSVAAWMTQLGIRDLGIQS